MQKQLENLKTFQKTFNSPYSTFPTLLSEKDWRLRYELMKEENEEYEEACLDKDLVGILDANIDMLFLAIGNLVAHGFSDVAEAAFEEVFRSIMSKTEEDGTVLINGVNAHDDSKPLGKILKSKRYFEPQLKQFI